jgi:hypothetical protein
MGFWAKSLRIFNSIGAHGQQSVRRLAARTGLSQSSVHRHTHAMHAETATPSRSCGKRKQATVGSSVWWSPPSSFLVSSEGWGRKRSASFSAEALAISV